jgi:hypothetical protein
LKVTVLTLIVAVLTLLLRAAVPPITAQESQARVSLDASRIERDQEDQIKVDVSAEDVSDLGGFEFILTFDGSAAEPAERPVELGPFLASSGREPLCDEVTVSPDAIRYACVTLGAKPREGAAGSGMLASVYLRAKEDAGTLGLELSRVELATPPGDRIPSEAGATSIDLGDGDSNWPLLVVVAGAAVLIIAAVGVAAVFFRRRSASAPPPPPLEV